MIGGMTPFGHLLGGEFVPGGQNRSCAGSVLSSLGNLGSHLGSLLGSFGVLWCPFGSLFGCIGGPLGWPWEALLAPKGPKGCPK